MDATTTLHAVIHDARHRLERAGIEPVEAALDAELLARHALGGWERGQLFANWRDPAPAGFVERLDPLVGRRERREPTAYITGHREFWGIEIEVEPGVLIPRPETEFIVEEVLAHLTPNPEAPILAPGAQLCVCGTTVPPRPRSWKPARHVLPGHVADITDREAPRGICPCLSWPSRHVLQTDALRQAQDFAVGLVRGAASETVLPLRRAAAPAGSPDSNPCAPLLRIADVGTGSGCLAIALARWLPAAHVVATDVSAAALVIAARNVSRNEVHDRVTLVRCDLLDAAAGQFDVIVSNPPYILTGDLASLQSEILNYEPRLALDAGADGLDVIRRLVPTAASRLVPGGWLIFEFGDGQAASVREIIRAEPRLEVVALRDDLAGIPRVAVACRNREYE